MSTQRDQIREDYAAIAQGANILDSTCCSPTSGCCAPAKVPDALARNIGYDDAELLTLPDGANLGLSCGNPTAIAALKPGEVVLDLGSGGGFDCLLQAQKLVRPVESLVLT